MNDLETEKYITELTVEPVEGISANIYIPHDHDLVYHTVMLNKCLSYLKSQCKRRYSVVVLYYGLFGIDPLPVRKIANRMNVSGNRIYHLRISGLKMMKQYCEKNNYEL